MRRLATLLVCCCWVLFQSAAVSADDGFKPLFNGKDLTNWDGDPALWSVKDGLITGVSDGSLKGNTFLIWTGGTVSDFELRVEFRFEGNNNTGVQYRSVRRPELGKWGVSGYQADVHAKPSYTGMIYEEKGRGILVERGNKVTITPDGKKQATPLGGTVEPIDLEQWHTLTIIAQGNKIIQKIDGKVAIELIDEQASHRRADGIIALQLHAGPPSKAQFRKVELKDLSKPATPAPGQSETSAAPAAPKWITAAAPKADGDKKKEADSSGPGRVFLTREFVLDGPVKSGRLLLSCADKAQVSINGVQIAEHSGARNASNVDVAPLFTKAKAGDSVKIAFEAEGKGKNVAGLMILELIGPNGEIQTVVTDDQWNASLKPLPNWKSKDVSTADWSTAKVAAALGEKPFPLTEANLAEARKLKDPVATPVDRMIVAKGFQVERIYSVPKAIEGSWVSMCLDPQGRLIVCDQYGGLFRVTPPGIKGAESVQIESIPVDIGEAQGLLWAFDSLYVVVNKGAKYESGVYRVTDTNKDDMLDTVETLRLLPGSGGEHGPHAAVLSPDGKSIYIICGNKTDLTEFAATRVPEIWDEDQMLPRIYGKGFMKGVPAPGGYISKMSPDGKEWELVNVGYRNQYDAAFNADGEMFTYDADMEWDLNTPWYRPTRVCQILSGVDYGWRNGSGKFPEYFADTMKPVLNIGPGSPTGVCFGYGAKFPAKYQRAFYIADWSYGKLYAVHLEPNGAGYKAKAEEFITGTPLPLTDLVVNPVDQAMYFAIGGRKVQSGLYKVTYVGSDSTAPAELKDSAGAKERAQLRKLQALHLGDHPEAVKIALPFLASNDPILRSAARTAIEFRPRDEWMPQVLESKDTWTRLEGLLAICRTQVRATRNPKEAVDTVPPRWDSTDVIPPAADLIMQMSVLASLGELDDTTFTPEQSFASLRIIQLALLRFGTPEEVVRQGLIDRLGEILPTPDANANTMLLDILCYLQAPKAAAQGVALLQSAPSQEEQMNYAKALSYLRAGWTPQLRETYFKWFHQAVGYRGGVGFDLFVNDIRKNALETLSDAEKEQLKPILEHQPMVAPVAAVAPRPFVKEWKRDEVLDLMQNKLNGRDFENGRKLFGAASCYTCHRFNGEGGALGPDLTALAGRFDATAILESIIDPNKEISDQYAAVQIITIDGKVVIGRIMNLHGEVMRINTNMLDPNETVGVEQRQIEEMSLSKTSMMPAGLLNTLNEEEVLDLMAFLLSRGDRNHAMFKSANSKGTAGE